MRNKSNIWSENVPFRFSKSSIKVFLFDFAKTVVTFLVGTLVSLIMMHASDFRTHLLFVFVMIVAIVARFTTGYFWGSISSLIAMFEVNYFFTYPYLQLDFTRSGYPITFFCMLALSTIICTMTAQIKRQATVSSENEKKTAYINELNNKLLATQGIDNIIELTLTVLQDLFKSSVAFFYINDSGNTLVSSKCTCKDCDDFFGSAYCRSIVDLALEKDCMQVIESKNNTNIMWGYVPIKTNSGFKGVVCVGIKHKLNVEELKNSIIAMMLAQVTMAIEKQLVEDSKHQISLESEREKMRSNLLRAISHDLRTPLTGIMGACSTILENKSHISEETEISLLNDVENDAKWLIRMVENLLSVTRISDGVASLKTVPEAVEEVVAQAISRIRAHYKHTKINVRVPDDFLMAYMDATLIEQVLINLVENAIKHSGDCSKIDVVVTVSNEWVVFEVSDNGNGIDPEVIPLLFSQEQKTAKSNISRSDGTRGMGIGLSICMSIIHAHGGEINVFNRENSGAVFRFTLPYSADDSITDLYDSEDEE